MRKSHANRDLRIAIQHDEVVFPDGHRQSFSERWIELAESNGYEAHTVDVFADKGVDAIQSCDCFMWRFGFLPEERLVAKRIIPAIEKGYGIPVYPDSRSAWHFEDKIAQYYILRAIGIPQPRTWVLWRRETALEHCQNIEYPMVLKLAHGFQSDNVSLIKSWKEAKAWIEELFGPGLTTLAVSPARLVERHARRARAAARLVLGMRPRGGADLSQGYLYLQEFIPGNEFDIRVMVIGNRAFGFRRFNREGDFRASGSGHVDVDPAPIPTDVVRQGFHVSRALGARTLAIDILYKNGQWVVTEVSYMGTSRIIPECPGYWRRVEGKDEIAIEWVSGKIRAEDAIFEDFVSRVRG